jgi:hypothetical protein
MTSRLLSYTLLALCGVSMFGCAPTEFATVTILETPTAFVRLEIDRTIKPDQGHAHPAVLTPAQMAAVLSGITIEEPWARLPIYDDTSQPRRHPAFTETEVAFFSPLLAMALSKGTPEEVITFYQSRAMSGSSREVTSGGLFVQGDELHIILANYRSPTHFSADIGMADTNDDRLTPMRALAPQRGTLNFSPQSARREASAEGLTRWFQQDRREVIVLYKLLSTRPQDRHPLP